MAGGAPRSQPTVSETGPTLGWSGQSDKRSYYRLFGGYVLALFATGIATVALALLAFDLEGDDSGAVIGTALSIKMLAYVFAAPVLTVLTDGLPRRSLLIALDLVRAASLVLLPFVTEVWQVYALVFVFATASATFGFVYLAVVPYLLGSEEDYTRSLARSRIASELEGPLSPLMAAGLMVFLGATGLFVLSACAFAASALLVRQANLPRHVGVPRRGIWQKLTRGPALFVAVPKFRAIIALDVAVALASAMVMVNTVVIVQGGFDLTRDASALAFAAFGLGAIVAAVLLPLALSRAEDRRLMLAGSAILSAALLAGTLQAGPCGPAWALGGAWAGGRTGADARHLPDPTDRRTGRLADPVRRADVDRQRMPAGGLSAGRLAGGNSGHERDLPGARALCQPRHGGGLVALAGLALGQGREGERRDVLHHAQSRIDHPLIARASAITRMP